MLGQRTVCIARLWDNRQTKCSWRRRIERWTGLIEAGVVGEVEVRFELRLRGFSRSQSRSEIRKALGLMREDDNSKNSRKWGSGSVTGYPSTAPFCSRSPRKASTDMTAAASNQNSYRLRVSFTFAFCTLLCNSLYNSLPIQFSLNRYTDPLPCTRSSRDIYLGTELKILLHSYTISHSAEVVPPFAYR